ncbi:MAG: hypothetical protein K9N06_13730 [Candidatus Cloacimonetes bacterium]|nr:hypothetical protein [Candidatus Cloacimonadota bacterium]
MEFGMSFIEIVLAAVFVGLVIIAILIDHRNGQRNRKTKENVRSEILNQVKKKGRRES